MCSYCQRIFDGVIYFVLFDIFSLSENDCKYLIALRLCTFIKVKGQVKMYYYAALTSTLNWAGK